MLEKTELSTFNESSEFSLSLDMVHVEDVLFQVPESGDVWQDD
jgi:hypothetical protein